MQGLRRYCEAFRRSACEISHDLAMFVSCVVLLLYKIANFLIFSVKLPSRSFA